MDVQSVSLYNIYSGPGSSENVARWTCAKREGLGKGSGLSDVPIPCLFSICGV